MNIFLLVCFIVLLAYLTKKKPVYGIAFYFMIRMSIPVSARIFSFSFNTLCMFTLLILLAPKIHVYYISLKKHEKKSIRILLKLYGILLMLTFFSFRIPIIYQWNKLFQEFCTEIFPALLLIIFLRKAKDYILICKIVLIMSCFTGFYGLYTFFFHVNPIVDYFSTIEIEGSFNLSEDILSRGILGTAIGIYTNTIALSVMCLVLFMFIFIQEKVINKYIRLIALIVLTLAIVFTTKRAALFCIALFVVAYYFEERKINFKILFNITSLLVVCFLIFSFNEQIFDLVSSALLIFDDSSQEAMGGSSMEMRINQLINCIDYLGLSNILQVEGFNFVAYYYTFIYKSALYGLDPRFYGFESIILRILMGSGLIGLFIWGKSMLKWYRCLYFNNSRMVYLCFFCVYWLEIIMTDIAGSLWIFFFLAVMNGKSYLLKE